jgi:hypothetical protein
MIDAAERKLPGPGLPSTRGPLSAFASPTFV